VPFLEPPRCAAWQHREARTGFEVVFLSSDDGGLSIEGSTAAIERDDAWAVQYRIALDPRWLTRSAHVTGHVASGRHELTLQSDRAGAWRIDGVPAPRLDGCLDVDLESSALTNTLPVHRLGLRVGEEADAPAAFVRALDLSVERLEQHYARLADVETGERYHYAAPAFGFECELLYDEFGLLLDYPGIATRAA
jgi:hypothetical protein